VFADLRCIFGLACILLGVFVGNRLLEERLFHESVVLNITLDNIVSESVYELTLIARKSSEYVDCVGCRFCYVICIGKFSILSSIDVAEICLECLLSLGLECV
jgi:formate hydrogenlyase subunit 6/NADH:ubiquinone oxidoreductase subunit I